MSVWPAIPFATAVAAAWRLLALGMFLAADPALAASYSLPGRIPSSPFNNCHLDSGTLYVCSGDLQIGSNDTINFTQDMTLKVEGNFKLSNNSNIYGNNHAVTIQADGNIELGNSFVGSVNFIAGQDFTAGNTAAITGNISAGGNITLGNSASITGNVSTDGNLEVGSGTINGTCTYQTTNFTCSAVASLDHVRIEHSGAGITCLREPVTIKACQTSDCSTLYTSGSVSLTLSPGGAWYAATSGGTALNAVTFTGSTTLYFEKTTAGTVTLSASGISPSPPNGFKCYVGNVQSCSLAFSNAGFIVSAAVDGAEAGIPPQTAGTSSSIHYLRAVKTGTTTKACEAALTGPNSVNFAYECLNPATCHGTDLMAVNGGTSTSVARNNGGGAVSAYTAVDMTFDANGNAPFVFNYGDVGQVKLHMAKPAGGALVAGLGGSTNAFVVRPSGFVLTDIKQTALPNLANPGAADATGAKFVKAGETFSVTVTAKAGSGTAYSFGREDLPEEVTLGLALIAPSGGSNGALANATVAGGSFTNGVATATNLSWSDVGIITLTPANADYLGAGGVAGTASGNVGRFYPDHFDTEATHACVCVLPVVCDFTYSGQPFPLKVTARAVGGATTSNYAGAFAKTVTLSDATGATGSFAPATLTSSDFVGGVADKTTTPSVAFSFANPLTSPAALGLRVTDSDGVSSASGAEGTTTLRSGRLRLSNANGSELLGLPLPLALQYYASATLGWQTNTLDHCTTIAAANFAFAFPAGAANKPNNLGACETAIAVGGSAPNYTVTLAAPGAGNDGWADITLNLGATAAGNACTAVGAANPAATTANAPWLRYNWSGTVADPRARATFGVYKSGRIIHRREAY